VKALSSVCRSLSALVFLNSPLKNKVGLKMSGKSKEAESSLLPMLTLSVEEGWTERMKHSCDHYSDILSYHEWMFSLSTIVIVMKRMFGIKRAHVVLAALQI
jgi:hypothetical protein